VPSEGIARYLDAAVRIAEDAAAMRDTSNSSFTERARVKIALSLGPYGACMVPSQEYSGQYDVQHDNEESLQQWHGERLALFAQVPDIESRVDYIAFETVPRRDEILAIRRAMVKAPPQLRDKPFWISCLYPANSLKKDRMPDGTPALNAVMAMLDDQVADAAIPWGVGVNCTHLEELSIRNLAVLYRAGMQKMGRLVVDATTRAARLEQPALILYPDGTDGKLYYDTAAQEWRDASDGSPSANASCHSSWAQKLSQDVWFAQSLGGFSQILVGGCCKTAPGDIRELAERLRQGQ
jgi:homocysteine S-methyltransferase